MLDTLGTIYLRRENAKRAPASEEVVAAHTSMREQIERVLAETGLYHGTGRFTYKPQGSSKYDGVAPDEVVDVFSLLLEQGLRPQEDLFSELFTGEELSTISLTHLRMYARVYADLFEDENNPSIQYEHGSRAFWWQFLVGKMVLHFLTDPDYYKKVLRWYLKERWHADKQASVQKRLERMDQWQRTFRNDDKFKLGAGIGQNLMTLMCYGGSTIPDNHGVLIGIRAGAVTPVQVQQGYVRCFEIRAGHVIPPSDWTYVEAPQSRVSTVQAGIQAAGYDIPVFPMEVMEHHHAQMPLAQLSEKHLSASRPHLLDVSV